MANMVLDEIDIGFYIYLDIFANVKDAQSIQKQRFDKDSSKGKWLFERGIKIHHSTMQSTDLIKCIVYADLTEEQQVEYLLRFE